MVLLIPPIGLLHGANPLTVGGLLYPRWQWVGLLLTMALFVTLAGVLTKRRGFYLILTLAAALAIWANIRYVPPVAPTGWHAVSLSMGRGPRSYGLMR